MKYKIGIGINYWDDPKGLIRILQCEAYNICEVVYLIDGKYKGREDEEEYTVDIPTLLKNFPKIHYVKMRDKIQIEKRNRYLELAEQDDLDFLIVCDSDHVLEVDDSLEGELDRVMEYDKCRIFPIDFIDGIQVRTKIIKLLKKPFDYRHRQNTGPNLSFFLF